VSLEKKEVVESLPKETADYLREAKGLSADDIMKKYPDINLKRAIIVKDVH
jgi:hypothetical protein